MLRLGSKGHPYFNLQATSGNLGNQMHRIYGQRVVTTPTTSRQLYEISLSLSGYRLDAFPFILAITLFQGNPEENCALPLKLSSRSFSSTMEGSFRTSWKSAILQGQKRKPQGNKQAAHRSLTPTVSNPKLREVDNPVTFAKSTKSKRCSSQKPMKP